MADYVPSDINLSFEAFVQLRKSGKSTIGVTRKFSDAISQGNINIKRGAPIKTTIFAYKSWNFFGYITLISGIFESLRAHWWAIFPGIIGIYFIWKING